jgi:hypothetical protein
MLENTALVALAIPLRPQVCFTLPKAPDQLLLQSAKLPDLLADCTNFLL